MIALITGGARSGKSSFAQNQALRLSSKPIYIATAGVNDEEFAGRVNRHREERGSEWTTFETNTDLHELPLEGRVALVDCVRLCLAKIFWDENYHTENSLNRFKEQFSSLCSIDCTLIVVTNEIGMGVHAQTEAGRKFTDLQGWANQYIAEKDDEVILMVSGLPHTIKSTDNENP